MKTCWACGGRLRVIKGQPYHYIESGLDNVWLHGINQYQCESCPEGGPEIPNVDELHILIGSMLICKKYPLTGKEIKYIRKELGLKSKELANLISVSPQEFSKWENEKDFIKPPYDKSLRLIYVLNAEDKLGRVLHNGIRFTKQMASAKKPPAQAPEDRIEISVPDWFNILSEPIFSEECIRP